MVLLFKKTSRCALFTFVFGINQVAKVTSSLEQMQNYNCREKEFLQPYPSPAIVELLLPTKVSSSHQMLLGVPRQCLLNAQKNSILSYHETSFCLFPCCSTLILFGDVLFIASGLHETLYRWSLMAAATALMWVICPGAESANSSPNICFVVLLDIQLYYITQSSLQFAVAM